MSESSSSSSGGIGFFGLLAVLFIGLKLTGYIGWSWWWVLAPLWGPLAIALILFALFVGAGFVMAFMDDKTYMRRGDWLSYRLSIRRT